MSLTRDIHSNGFSALIATVNLVTNTLKMRFAFLARLEFCFFNFHSSLHSLANPTPEPRGGGYGSQLFDFGCIKPFAPRPRTIGS